MNSRTTGTSRWLAALPLCRTELFSWYSHLVGMLAALFGSVLLSAQAATLTGTVLAGVYGISLIFLFSASMLYHGFKTEEGGTGILRRLDHLAIFVMIAGSYTPICWLHLPGRWRWGLLSVQWGLVLVGAVVKLCFLRTPRVIMVAICLAMGWMVIFAWDPLSASVTSANLFLLKVGGVFFSAGAVCYVMKRPDPYPGVLGFHEIWHVCVLVGAGAHYAAIYRMLT